MSDLVLQRELESRPSLGEESCERRKAGGLGEAVSLEPIGVVNQTETPQVAPVVESHAEALLLGGYSWMQNENLGATVTHWGEP